jgi:hypothetical protein
MIIAMDKAHDDAVSWSLRVLKIYFSLYIGVPQMLSSSARGFRRSSNDRGLFQILREEGHDPRSEERLAKYGHRHGGYLGVSPGRNTFCQG